MIRRAAPADAQGIARVHVATWQFAYQQIVAPEVLAGLGVDDRAEAWSRRLAEGATAWVCEVDARVVGFASVDGARLMTLYVDPVAQGAGVGSALLAQAEGAGARQLEVFEANGHARRFYDDRGWREDGPGERWLDRPVLRYVR